MNTAINNLLNELGDTIANELSKSRLQAEAANDQINIMRDGLFSILNGLVTNTQEIPKPANDADVSTTIHRIAKKKSATQAVRALAKQPCIDANLLDALSTEWTGAGKLHKLLTSQGIHISEGSVYNRMRKLCAEYPQKVEATVKPERWRLKFAPAGITKKPEHHVVPKVARKNVKRKSVIAAPTATNDNVGGVYTPVLHHGDCLKIMQTIPDGSVDLIVADLPYGVTKCSFDKLIPLNLLWDEYRRVIKPTGAIVLFAAQPFTSALAASNREWLKYSLVWQKPKSSNFLQCKNKPMIVHEDILVFSPGTTVHKGMSKRRMTFNPQGVSSAGMKTIQARRIAMAHLGTNRIHGEGTKYEAFTGYPNSVLQFGKDAAKVGIESHPFAKPVALLEYLINTYSNAGEKVLDNTMGSGSTCIAAMKTGRRSIGIEMDRKWFDIAQARVAAKTIAGESVNPTCNVANDDDDTLGIANTIAEPGGHAPLTRQIETNIPVTRLDNATIYNGDCLEVMRKMPSGSVDLIFTSPPYNRGKPGQSGRKKTTKSTVWVNSKLDEGYATFNDALPHAQYVAWQKEVLKECWRLLKPDGAIFYNHKPRIQKGKLWTPLELNPGLPIRQIVIWDRGSGMNFNYAFYLPTHEYITIFAKPRFKLKPKCAVFAKDIWSVPMEKKNKHPAPFPVALPKIAIESTESAVILDPFMGSGSTGVAAIQCGREFIGIELAPEYVAQAVKRISAEIAEAATPSLKAGGLSR